jgi:Tol biopolymer transport system component
MFSGVGAPNFAVANDGTLVYARRSSRTSRLEWRDRDGNVLERVGRPARYNDAHLSPDERTLAVAIFDPETSAGDLWLLDLERGVSTRATSEARSTHSLVWSPDGRRIAFAMPRGAPPFMHVYTLGGGEPDVLLPSTGTNQWPWDWLDDGRIVFGDRSPETNWDLWVLSPDGKETQPLLATQYVERDACVSPDGRWLAYVSDESGTDEIYVRDFPGLGEKHRVSTEGGARPEWGGDGSELYFVAGDGTLVAVPLSRGGFFRPGTAVTLFREDGLLDFDVTADGRRILVNVAEAGPGATAVVDRDWTAAAAGR